MRARRKALRSSSEYEERLGRELFQRCHTYSTGSTRTPHEKTSRRTDDLTGMPKPETPRRHYTSQTHPHPFKHEKRGRTFCTQIQEAHELIRNKSRTTHVFKKVKISLQDRDPNLRRRVIQGDVGNTSFINHPLIRFNHHNSPESQYTSKVKSVEKQLRDFRASYTRRLLEDLEKTIINRTTHALDRRECVTQKYETINYKPPQRKPLHGDAEPISIIQPTPYDSIIIPAESQDTSKKISIEK
ncbi:hypothetical protein BJ508DRAFT_312936 [Ascobolus immersus RN42]|uniref:Uncharacterized protein n=1 Tax=Ascobolus immersus RN42 TaxID=1160509 RepID=A0A3N4HQM4_ASCIM|nr:hypothetical protein BJ508DRAFT_312936 [Ascobolus immersus RN42]